MAALLVPMDGGSPVRIEKPITLVGRHQECDLSLPNYVKVSRRHCCIVQVDDRYVVRDLGSMNGLRVNGRRVNEMELKAGDELAIADAVFVFQYGSIRGGGRPASSGDDPSTGTGVRGDDSEVATPRMREVTDRSQELSEGRKPAAPHDSHSGSKFVEV